MAETDIELSVGLNVTDVEGRAKQLRKSIQDIFNNSKGKELSASLKSVHASLAKLYTESENVSKKMQELGNKKIPTEEYINLQNKLKSLENSFDKITDKMDRLRQEEKTDTEEFAKLEAEADKFYDAIDRTEQKLQQMEQTGKAFTLGSNTEEYQKLSDRQTDLSNRMAVTASRAELLRRKEEGLGETSRKTSNNVRKLQVSLASRVWAGIVNTLGRIVNAFRNLGNHANTARKNTNGLGLSFKQLLRYGLGIGSIYTLFNKIRGAIKDGLKSMAQLNNGNNDVNKNISILMTSLSQLKNALATAFAPILNIVTPILEGFINTLINVINTISMLIAKLTGQSAYIQAKKVQQDYAKSLDGTAKSAGKAEKALGKLGDYDELKVIGEESSGGGGGGGAGAESAFETQNISEEVNDFAEKMKEAMKDFFQPIQESWNKNGKKVMDAFNKACIGIKNNVIAIGNAFMRAWTGGAGQALLDSFFQMLTSILNLIGSITQAFANAWNSPSGTKLVESILGIITDIFDTISLIADAWATAFDLVGTQTITSIFDMISSILSTVDTIWDDWNSVWGEDTDMDGINDLAEVCTDILTTVGNIADGITSIVTNFQSAWNEGNRGKKIVRAIKSIIMSITSKISEMSASFAEWAKTLDFGPLLDALGGEDENGNRTGLLGAAANCIDTIMAGISWLQENIIQPFAGWVIEEAAPAALDSISATLEVINTTMQALSPYLQAFWDNFLEPLASATGQTIVDTLNKITDAMTFLNKVMKGEATEEDFAGAGKDLQGYTLTEMLFPGGNFAYDMGVNIADEFTRGMQEEAIAKASDVSPEFGEAAQTIFDSFDTAMKDKDWGTVWEIMTQVGGVNISTWWEDNIATPISETCGNIGTTVSQAWTDLQTWTGETFGDIKEAANENWAKVQEFMEDPVGNAQRTIKENWDTIKTNASTAWENTKKKAEEWWDNIKKAVTTPIDNAKQTLSEVWGNIKSKASEIWGKIQTKATEIWENIQTAIMTPIDTVKENAISAFNFIKTKLKRIMESISSTVGTIWDGIWTNIKGVINSILGGVESFANGIIDGLNAAIGAINNLQFTLPDWIPLVGGETLGFSIPTLNTISLPRLAQGAVIPPNKEFMAILGDQKSGTNIETPLDTMIEAFRTALKEENNSSNQAPIVLQLNSKEVARCVWDENEKRYKQTGRLGFAY